MNKRAPKGAQSSPKGAKRRPKSPQRYPREPKRGPNGTQRLPKGTKRSVKGVPKRIPKWPNLDRGLKNVRYAKSPQKRIQGPKQEDPMTSTGAQEGTNRSQWNPKGSPRVPNQHTMSLQ